MYKYVQDMVDTIHANVNNVPRNCNKVAGYVTGTPDIRWTGGDWSRFKGAKVPINQSNSVVVTAPVCDVEPGAMTIAVAVESVRARRSIGETTTIYLPESLLVECEQAISAAGLSDHTYYGIANWNLSRDEAIAALGGRIKWVQWASPSSNPNTKLPGTNLTLREANCDLSVTAADWFPAPVKKHTVPKPLIHHKKTVGSVGGGTAGVGLAALLSKVLKVHVTPVEGAAIATAIGYVLSYLAPNAYMGSGK